MVTPFHHPQSHEVRHRAAESLALEMRRGLGVDTNAEAVLDWINRRWHVISPLAHAIHEAEGIGP